MIKVQQELEELSERWEWEDEDMKLARIEAPLKTVLRMVEEGIYRPKIFRSNVRSYKDLEEAALIEEDEKIEDLFRDDGEPVKPLAGEIAMEELTWEDVREVEVELQEAVGELLKVWKEKQQLTKLDIAVNKAFGSFHDEVPGSGNGVQEHMKKLIHDIAVELPRSYTDQLNAHEVYIGFNSFNRFWRTEQERADCVLQCDDIYRMWYEKSQEEDIEENFEKCVQAFMHLFENVQVRSVSEAICETVGSVMSNKTGRGRILKSENFSKEVMMEMNLGPIHLLKPLASEVYTRRGKTYSYKTNEKGFFVTRYVKDRTLGAAVKSVRETEETRSRLPQGLWAGVLERK